MWMKKLGFELSHLPIEIRDSEIDGDQFLKMADAFLERGFTYFDTAGSWKNETVFQEAVVKRYHRFAYTVTDQIPDLPIQRTEELQDFFDMQLEHLGVEYMDYYLIRAENEMTFQKMEKLCAFDFVKKLKKEGSIKHIGLLYRGDAARLKEIFLLHPEIEYIQMPLQNSCWYQEKGQTRLCYETAVRYRKPVISMAVRQDSDLGRTADPSGVMVVLAGMKNQNELEKNMQYFEK